MSQPLSTLAPFRLPITSERTWLRPIADAVRSAAEWAVGFNALNHVYREASRASAEAPFCDRVLSVLRARFLTPEADLKRIPRQGPLIVVANHPFGGLDGLGLLSLLLRVRSDVRLMANYLLGCMPEMAASCILVDPFGGREAIKRNRTGAREAIDWLRRGGVLAVFPAGEVSSLRLREGRVVDPQWSTTATRLALQCGVPILPVFFHGRNSGRFQVAGLVHPRLRTALLPRELLSKRGQSFDVRVGSPISPQRLAAASERISRANAANSHEELTKYLRSRVYVLANRVGLAPAHTRRVALDPPPLHPPIDPDLLATEVNSLPADALLVRNVAFDVYLARAAQIPNILTEIGRLRERTFRPVGEGVGKPLDLDEYDQSYRHLFVWQRERREIVGAYRVGATDEIMAERGIAGLYTHSLFRYEEKLIDRIGPALEMGRSFVVAEYQREYQPLLLLWRGIGAIVVREPRYRFLFGGVSISDQYRSVTKDLLIAFLRANRMDDELAALTHPKRPPQTRSARTETASLASIAKNLDEVDEIVRELEADGKSAPVLLRQYLRLNARIIAFNIDPDFGDALDGLVVIDLTRVDRPILERYLTKPGAASFLAAHHCDHRDIAKAVPANIGH